MDKQTKVINLTYLWVLSRRENLMWEVKHEELQPTQGNRQNKSQLQPGTPPGGSASQAHMSDSVLHWQHKVWHKLHPKVTLQWSFHGWLFGSGHTGDPSSQSLGAAQLPGQAFPCSAGFRGTSQLPVLACGFAAAWESGNLTHIKTVLSFIGLHILGRI